MSRGIERGPALAVIGALGALVLVNVPLLGSDPWPFEPGRIDPAGPLAFLVRAADAEWNVGFLRAPALIGGLLLGAAAAVVALADSVRAWALAALCAVVVALLVLPGVLLQVALRDSTAPWFFTNDSTYQIELAGDLVREGTSPYGHDYRFSGLERFYSLDGTVSDRTRESQVALRHFAYFPGTPATAAAWTALPRPWDDYRLLVALCTLALLPAALAFRGPLDVRLIVGAALAANPLAVRAVWFGNADAVSLLLLVLAFALLTRERWLGAAAALAGAILLKQFALVALPFFAVFLLMRCSRRRAAESGAVFGGVLLAGALPVLLSGPSAYWSDTVSYGASTYRIVGYGLAQILEEAGIVQGHEGEYPFLALVLALWLPATAALAFLTYRARDLATGAMGFTISMFLLLYISRAFQTSHLIWPLVGIGLTALCWAYERERPPPSRAGPSVAS